MTELPENIKDKAIILLMEHIDPENFVESLGLFPHQVKPVWDKVIYAFSLGTEFGYISSIENVFDKVQEIFPEAKDILEDALSGYVAPKLGDI